jgi:hypothetical protein
VFGLWLVAVAATLLRTGGQPRTAHRLVGGGARCEQSPTAANAAQILDRGAVDGERRPLPAAAARR